MKQPPPANFAGMNHRVGVSGNAIENRAGAPRLARGFNGHINDDRRADDVFARDAAGEAAVERIAAIIAHYENTAGRDGVREDISPSSERAEIVVRVSGLGAADSVVFAKAGTVDPDAAVMNIHGFARQADHPLDDVRRFAGNDGAENDNLLAIRRAPQRLVNIGERNADVVAEAAHDEVVADEQSIFHGLGGNDASLADGGIDEEKNQNDPSPCDDFAAAFLLRCEIFVGLSLFRLFIFDARTCLGGALEPAWRL